MNDENSPTGSLRARQGERLFFTWSVQGQARPFEIVAARGARFEVAGEGWKWDLESQVYNVNVGHGHPHVKRRMTEQIEALPAAAPNALLPVRARLGELLAEKTGLAKAFLTTGGSEAVENAIKIARLVTGRSKIVTRRHSYHGATLAVLGVAGDDRKAAFEADLDPAYHIEDPFPARAPTTARASDWLESFDALLGRESPDTIAAVVLEALTGTNGMQEPPADFWPGVRERCDRHGILLIDDEIFAGFGRTGRWFGRELWGVEVDMMTIGKGLTSGYAPLAGVMVSEEIAARFDEQRLWCGLTHYAHPVSCAAAVGSIEALEADHLVDNAAVRGLQLAQRLDALVAAPGAAVGRRGHGLMQALELRDAAGPVARRLWDLGAYVPYRDNLLFLCPPLCIDRVGLDEVCGLIERAV